MKVSVVIPASNERQRIAETLQELRTYLSGTTEFFELIVVNDSFEHFPDPKEVLNRCWKLLRPEGLLLINMTDPDSWLVPPVGRSWIASKLEPLLLYPRATSHRLFEGSSCHLAFRFASWQALDWRI